MPLTSHDIERLYRHEAQRLAGFFVRRTHDPEVALDLVGETFASAVRDRAAFRGSEDVEATAWLFAIARNLLSRWYRDGAVERKAMSQLGIERPALGEAEHERLVELAGLAELRAQVASELGALPRDQRVAVELRVVGERSYAEIADALQVSEQVARARVSRGLRAMAASMEAGRG